MKKKKNGLIISFVKWICLIVISFILLSLCQVLILKYIPIKWTPLMVRRQWEAHTNNRSFNIKKQWTTINNISPEMIRAIIASEDNLFVTHNGFSESGLRNAIKEKINNGYVKHGGSTISQQTAKNVFTTGSRTYLRKAFEIYYTFLIEWIWGKERIMEVYLNIIETGNGIFGIEAASEEFFHCPASKLDQAQAALIAVCLPNPHKLKVDRPSSYVLKRQKKIMILMPKLGRIDLSIPKNL